MLIAERLQKIVELVNERKSIRVTELADICAVTEETIRRDLDRLESEGKLLRSHGGAVSIRETHSEVPYGIREVMHTEEKRRIAEEAVRQIAEDERIVLDASSTAWWMAKLLPDMPLTVLTNSIKVAVELSAKPKIRVISTGGMLSPGSLSYVGQLTERALEQFHVDKLFLSCKGVHVPSGISESNELQALVKQKMIGIADRVYLLADHSKFGVRAFTQVAGWSDIHHVITDERTAADMLQALADYHVDVIKAEG